MFTEDWSKHIKIDREKILRQLNQHFIKWDDKIALRFYTLKPSGTQLLVDGLSAVLHDSLPYYVYGEDEIKRNSEMWAGLNAGNSFGIKNPHTDGKYGELLLFVLVESVLACKMVAHKIRSLTNTKDQIKGGDGIFIGNYRANSAEYPAYLIGESKVTSTFGVALKEAFGSIGRFHDLRNNAGFLNNELIVAKDFIKVTDVDLDELYDRLTPTTERFQNQVLVHPVLLMYSTPTFQKLQTQSANKNELEDNIRGLIKGKEKHYLTKIKTELANYPEVQKVYLDFFILPCDSVNDFRDYMFKKIHHVPFQYLNASKDIADDRA